MNYRNKFVQHAEIELNDELDDALEVLENVVEGRIRTTMPFVLSFGGVRMKIRTHDELHVALGMLNGATNIQENLYSARLFMGF